jgi:spore germination protein YaaH
MPYRHRLAAVSILFLVTTLAACGPGPQSDTPAADTPTLQEPAGESPPEVLMYVGGNGERGLEQFRQHAGSISIVAPQAFRVDADGNITGGVLPELMEVAGAAGVHVMPLIVNPGFNQELFHSLMDNPEGRLRAVESMVELAREHGFYGWQFDFENVHVTYRDSLTSFYRQTAEALHDGGFKLSIAVVPSDGSEGEIPFARYMQDNWRNSFDMAALAEAGDFITLMTYAQHGGPTAPGPIAGLPWVRRMTDHALAVGVPPDKLSFGVPSYSGHWYPHHHEDRGLRMIGREIPYSRVQELLASSGAAPEWLPEQGVHRVVWEQEGTFQWMFIEEGRSLRAKLDLFDSYPGLRGISVWVLRSAGPEFWPVLEEWLGR